MEKFNLEGTNSSPKIVGDHDNGTLLITGVCIPENATEFFQPIRNWISAYINSNNKFDVEVYLDYFNTTTSHILLDIFKELSEYRSSKEISINWIYEPDDTDMMEAGEEYNMILDDFLTIRPKE